MTDADLLRQALHLVDGPWMDDDYEDAESIILDAARFALKVWEGDEQLVEQMAKAMCEGGWDGYELPWEDSGPIQQQWWIFKARAVLAAITEGEKK